MTNYNLSQQRDEPTIGHDGADHTFASATSDGTVTPSDATVLDFNALYVGGAGHVVISRDGGVTTTTYYSVPAGSILPVSGDRVMAATAATLITWMKW